MKKISYEFFFKALSNGTRLGIIHDLRKGPKNVSQLSRNLGFEQSRVSHNLRILETWGLLSSRRDGKNRVYSLDEKHLIPILDNIDGYLGSYKAKLCSCGILNGNNKCQHMKR
jgi:ArsR family transcriptional regulator, zinc-responsive transcriptional repressor